MAGLQQYYFFPTDFFYPRPHPSDATLETASSGKPTVIPSQTPNGENQDQQQQPRSMIKVPPAATQALVCAPKRHSPIDKKLSKLSAKPLSYMVWSGEEDVDTY